MFVTQILLTEEQLMHMKHVIIFEIQHCYFCSQSFVIWAFISEREHVSKSSQQGLQLILKNIEGKKKISLAHMLHIRLDQAKPNFKKTFISAT